MNLDEIYIPERAIELVHKWLQETALTMLALADCLGVNITTEQTVQHEPDFEEPEQPETRELVAIADGSLRKKPKSVDQYHYDLIKDLDIKDAEAIGKQYGYSKETVRKIINKKYDHKYGPKPWPIHKQEPVNPEPVKPAPPVSQEQLVLPVAQHRLPKNADSAKFVWAKVIEALKEADSITVGEEENLLRIHANGFGGFKTDKGIWQPKVIHCDGDFPDLHSFEQAMDPVINRTRPSVNIANQVFQKYFGFNFFMVPIRYKQPSSMLKHYD